MLRHIQGTWGQTIVIGAVVFGVVITLFNQGIKLSHRMTPVAKPTTSAIPNPPPLPPGIANAQDSIRSSLSKWYNDPTDDVPNGGASTISVPARYDASATAPTVVVVQIVQVPSASSGMSYPNSAGTWPSMQVPQTPAVVGNPGEHQWDPSKYRIPTQYPGSYPERW